MRTLLYFCGLASVALLAAALVAEYGFGLAPCELCMAQRYPYVLIAAIALAFAVFPASERVRFFAAGLGALLFLVDGGIAFYHTGVEFGWFPGPGACTNHETGGQTLEEMRAAIMNAALVPCDQPMAHILGLSLAAWNAVAAFSLAIISIFALKKIHAKKS